MLKISLLRSFFHQPDSAHCNPYFCVQSSTWPTQRGLDGEWSVPGPCTRHRHLQNLQNIRSEAAHREEQKAQNTPTRIYIGSSKANSLCFQNLQQKPEGCVYSLTVLPPERDPQLLCRGGEADRISGKFCNSCSSQTRVQLIVQRVGRGKN